MYESFDIKSLRYNREKKQDFRYVCWHFRLCHSISHCRVLKLFNVKIKMFIIALTVGILKAPCSHFTDWLAGLDYHSGVQNLKSEIYL